MSIGSPIHSAPSSPRKLRFGVEILEHTYTDPTVFDAAVNQAERYGVEEVLFWGGLNVLIQDVTVPGFEKFPAHEKRDAAARFRSWQEKLKEKGLRVVADGREPFVPSEFFEAYPEAKCVGTNQLWDFLEKRMETILRNNPCLDQTESFLWETQFLNDDLFFDGVRWFEKQAVWFSEPKPYAPVDYLIELISALARGAQNAGKVYAQKGFAHHRWEESLLVDAIRDVPLEVPFRVSTQMQFGDFNPFMPPPALVPANQVRPMTMYCDCFGEYLGRSQVPYCYPERLQQRVQWAFEKSAALDCVRARINFSDGWNAGKTTSLFGTPNEINLMALSRLARDPYCSIKDIWQEFVSERYGKAATEAVILALRRSCEIVRKTIFFHGTTLAQHSEVPVFAFLKGRIRHSSYECTRARPENVEENAILHELAHGATPFVLHELLTQIDQAHALALQSMQDIEAASKDLSSENYEKLKELFAFSIEYNRVYRLIAEIYTRLHLRAPYRDSGNTASLHAALTELEKHAAYAHTHYNENSILNGEKMRRFIEDARGYEHEQGADEK